jgi:hypothetical protein
VSLDKADMLDGACFYDRKKQVMHFKLNKLQQYLQANRQPMHSRELTFKITKILNGRKNNGKVKDRLGQERSCPTWEYPEDRDNFIITFNGNEAPQELENAEN